MPVSVRVTFWTFLLAGWTAALGAGSVWIKSRVQPLAGASSLPATTGCLAEGVKRTQSGFVARKPFPKNRLLRESDLDWTRPTGGAEKPAFLGRYTTCDVKAGDIVAAVETAAIPTVKPASGHVISPIPIGDKEFQTINAGATLDVFIDRVAVASGAPVLAILCRQTPAHECAAIVDVDPDGAVRLADADAKDLRVVAIVKP